MTATRIPMLVATFALAGGCAGPIAPATTGAGPQEQPAAATTQSEGPALAIEEAERSLDVGKNPAGARESLANVLADPAATPEQKDEAQLAMSRALEATGDREGAIAAVEALLASHPAGARYPLQEAASSRLRVLLTGHDASPPPREDDTRPVAPFANALVKYYPGATTGTTPIEISVFAYGGSSETSDRLGTFAISHAIRDLRDKACPLCDDHTNIHTHQSRSGSWTAIPRDRAQLPNVLAVYYYDLGDGRIPSRYDAELPLPSADVAARLARGDGLIAVRERPGAPPAVLLAAPRAGQLADVEEVLAGMKTIPTEPVTVPLKSGLKASEIQNVVRATFSVYKACYGEVLKTDPTATGTSRIHFAIRGDGSVESVSMDSDPALRDATFEACMTAATKALVFPATHSSSNTTVTYPVMFAPGP